MKFPILIQLGENGQITLPAELLAAIDAKPGDWLPIRVEEGEVRVRKLSNVAESLEALGTALHEAGVTEEGLLESGREIRKQLVRERYPACSKTRNLALATERSIIGAPRFDRPTTRRPR